MKRSSDRILTTHPGKLPDPANRDDVMQARSAGNQARFDELVKQGAQWAFAKQREAGIDIMSDGEFWKARDQIYYGSRASGIEAKPLAPGEWPSLLGDHQERHMPQFEDFFAAYDKLGNTPRPGVVNPPATEKSVITGPVQALPPDRINHEIAVIKSALDAAGIPYEDYFFPVLGPGWLDHFIFDEHYKTEEEYVFALAEVVKNDYKAVVDAGLTLQIDDPGLCDRWSMILPAVSIEEYRRQEAIRVEATNYALKGIPEESVRFHTCWGSWHTPHTNDLPFEHIIDLMLRINAGAYSIEAADVRHEHGLQGLGADEAAGRQAVHPRRRRPQDDDHRARRARRRAHRALRQPDGPRERDRGRRLRRRRPLLPRHRLGEAQGAIGRRRASRPRCCSDEEQREHGKGNTGEQLGRETAGRIAASYRAKPRNRCSYWPRAHRMRPR